MVLLGKFANQSHQTPSSMPHEPTTASSHMDEVMEEEEGDVASQNSCKDSTSSIGDFDPDDTMTSQQTVATELTQPVPSRVSQVSLRPYITPC